MGNHYILGPHRVFPGRLSVSRTFGDIEAKLEKYGGNPEVVVATPEILEFKITDNIDFIVLGCDGIFDKLTNEETSDCVWKTVKDFKAPNIH
jgi:protein phosphatase 2C family protein 2/3